MGTIQEYCIVLNKSWKQHCIKQQLYSHLPPISQTIQVRQARHAEHYWEIKDELISNIILWTPTHGHTSVGQPAKTYKHQLGVGTDCSLEDPLRVIAGKDRW